MTVTAPQGFRSAGIAVGLKSTGKPDLALVVNDGPQRAAAVVFTSNRAQANPILWTLSVAFFMEGFMRFAWSNNQVYPDTASGTPGEAFIGIFRFSFLSR